MPSILPLYRKYRICVTMRVGNLRVEQLRRTPARRRWRITACRAMRNTGLGALIVSRAVGELKGIVLNEPARQGPDLSR